MGNEQELTLEEAPVVPVEDVTTKEPDTATEEAASASEVKDTPKEAVVTPLEEKKGTEDNADANAADAETEAPQTEAETEAPQPEAPKETPPEPEKAAETTEDMTLYDFTVSRDY
jgi:hypothetical protein